MFDRRHLGEVNMRIEHTPAIIPVIGPALKPMPVSDKKAIEALTPAMPSSSVAISGQTLLRQRLFYSPADIEPPMADIRFDQMAPKSAHYLNKDDRLLLGEVYEFAQSECIDLEYVDRLGYSLAYYRESEDGQRKSPHNRGMVFDLEGHMLSYSFTDEDTVAAKKVRESPDLQTTRLDRGFIERDTDEDYSSMSHSHFGFLELVVNRFSASPDLLPVDGRFAQHHYKKHDFIAYVSKEVYEHALFGKHKKTQGGKEASQAVDADTPRDVPATLRDIIGKYLQKKGLPTLFETIARLRR
jgi:hypothetical protein